MCPRRARTEKHLIVVGAGNAIDKTVLPYSGTRPSLLAPESAYVAGTSFGTAYVSGTSALLSEALERQSTTPLSHEHLSKHRADSFWELGCTDEAVTLYEALLDRDPHIADHTMQPKQCLYCQTFIYDVRQRVGLAYLQLGTFQRAAEYFQQNVWIAPQFAPAHMNLGAALRPMHPEASIAEYEIALTLDPKNADAHEGLGASYSELRDWSSAICAYRTAIALDSDVPRRHALLAHAYDQLGNTAAAKTERDIVDRLASR
jgi:tetratricopeptide (TPR) repeat protein